MADSKPGGEGFRSLRLVVKEHGPLPYTDAADYIRQAAEGLSRTHAAGLTHRNIKPGNLLVDQKNVVKVVDLDAARFTDRDVAGELFRPRDRRHRFVDLAREELAFLTEEFDVNVLGTADYLAPEQALDNHNVDARSDIYSLGCSLYFLLTGHPPFPDGTIVQRLMAHQKQEPPSILKDRPDAPKDLIDICMRMMAKEPEQRYQSATDAAAALAQWLKTHG